MECGNITRLLWNIQSNWLKNYSTLWNIGLNKKIPNGPNELKYQIVYARNFSNFVSSASTIHSLFNYKLVMIFQCKIHRQILFPHFWFHFLLIDLFAIDVQGYTILLYCYVCYHSWNCSIFICCPLLLILDQQNFVWLSNYCVTILKYCFNIRYTKCVLFRMSIL